METIDELAGRVLTICTRMSESAHRITRAQRDLAKAKSDHDGDLQELRECSSRLAVRLTRIDKQETAPAFVPPGMKKASQAQEESLTGNSLNRVFEPDDVAQDSPSSDGLVHAAIEQTWNDLRGAFVCAHRNAMNFGEGAVCISNAGDEITATRIPPTAESEACVDGFEQCAKNVRSQQSVGPVAGALHPFRELGNDEFVPCKITHPAMVEACGRLLDFRRKEFDSWLKQHDLELIHGNRDWYLRSMSDKEVLEASNWVSRRLAVGCDQAESIRSAFDSMLLARKGS